jgi:hypothetical protein
MRSFCSVLRGFASAGAKVCDGKSFFKLEATAVLLGAKLTPHSEQNFGMFKLYTVGFPHDGQKYFIHLLLNNYT